MHLPRFLGSAPGALCLVGAALIALAGCGSDEVEGQQNCDPGERFNPVLGRCVEDVRGGDSDTGGDPDTSNDPDTGSDPDTSSEPDTSDAPDAGSDTDTSAGPDGGDGTDPDTYCGLDMDLSSPAVCEFYAHSPSTLYLIDPFRLTLEEVRSVPSGLYDIDTHPDGRLFGITPTALYRFDESTEDWNIVEPLSGLSNANGLCIDNFGQGYITSGNQLYTVDLDSGQVDLVGNMGGGFSSSGDCVVDKGNTLLMSSAPQGFSSDDSLVLLDGNSGQGSLRGRTGQADIYGLTAAWGVLFGTTGEGKLLRINSGTGTAEVLHDFGSVVFNGAASSPDR